MKKMVGVILIAAALLDMLAMVASVEPNQSLTVYSSHPVSNGYGKQLFCGRRKLTSFGFINASREFPARQSTS